MRQMNSHKSRKGKQPVQADLSGNGDSSGSDSKSNPPPMKSNIKKGSFVGARKETFGNTNSRPNLNNDPNSVKSSS